MKRIIILMILLLALGCTIKTPIEESTEKSIEDLSELEELEEATYNLFVGDIVKFNDVEIKFVKLNLEANLNAVFEVGGKKTTVYGTKTLDIVNGISLYIDSFIGPSNNLGIALKVRKFELESDNYIVKYADTLNIGGKRIFIRDILKDESILIDIGDKLNIRILNKETKVFDNLEVTNIRVFFKGSNVENYAILKIIIR